MIKLKNIAVACTLVFSGLSVQAQEQHKMQDQDAKMEMNKSQNDYGKLEKTQDEIEKTQIEIYSIVQNHPDFTYSYDRKDNTITAVNIEGVSSAQDERRLETHLLRLAELRDEIKNQSNRVGVFYVTEQPPKPKKGYDELYDNLYDNIEYPENAEDTGLEGNVYVKFVVDHKGNVENVIATTNLDPKASEHFASDELIKEAKEAVKSTSGQWEPAKIGDVAVAQWVVLPVMFRIEEPPALERVVMEDDFSEEDY